MCSFTFWTVKKLRPSICNNFSSSLSVSVAAKSQEYENCRNIQQPYNENEESHREKKSNEKNGEEL